MRDLGRARGRGDVYKRQVLIARLLVGPVDDVLRVAALGLATAAAYHVINFWIVPLSFPAGFRGPDIGTVLFGVSWGLGDVLQVGASSAVSYTHLTLPTGDLG